jgi:hypothetical protein
LLDYIVFFFGYNIQNLKSSPSDILLSDFRKRINIRQSFQTYVIALLKQEKERRSCIELQQKCVSFQNIDDMFQLLSILYSCMWENDLSFEAAILATNLKFFGINLNDLKLRIFSSD